MSTSTLAISCLTTSNLPWFMDLTFQVPMQYCSLQHQTLFLSPFPSTTGCCFCFGSIPSFFLELFLHWSPVVYWAPNWLGEFPLQYPIILPFHTVHGVLKAGILKWFAIPFSIRPHSVRPLQHDRAILGGPTRHGLVSLSYTRLWSMWSDWLVVCDCGFSLSALWCPLSAPTVLFGLLLPWTWGSLEQLWRETPHPSRAIKDIKTGKGDGMCNLVEELSLFYTGWPGRWYLNRTQKKVNLKRVWEKCIPSRGGARAKARISRDRCC